MQLLAKAERLIPAATQTYSKGPSYFIKGISPVFMESGEGCYAQDVDGNAYCDYILALGPITLGYKYPAVDRAIKKQLAKGINFSLPTALEIELAELMQEVIPCAEKMRLSKTGSEVTSAAVKAAMAYTGREHIANFGYSGWHSWFSCTTDRPAGIPAVYRTLIHPFKYNDLQSLEDIFNEYSIAAVIMEPVQFIPPAQGFLEGVKYLCHKNGAVFILDEMITGFRLDLGGAQKYFGITPDLATFGKGMANGMPLAALVGKKEIMDVFDISGHAHFSTTFGGEALSIAAGIATIKEMRDKNTPAHIARMGTRLMKKMSGIQELIMSGYPYRPIPMFPTGLSPEEERIRRSLLMQELCKRGQLIHSGGLNLCYMHKEEDIDKTALAFAESMDLINANKVKLEGEPIRPTFKR